MELTYLELDGIGFLSNILTIIPAFTHLTQLVVNPSRRSASLHQHFLTDELVCSVISACPLLCHLVVPIVGDGPLVRLAEMGTPLKSLDIVSGREVTDMGFVLFAKRIGPTLQSLELANAWGVSEVGLTVLARAGCLERLVLANRGGGPGGISGRRVLELFSAEDSGLRTSLVALANIPASNTGPSVEDLMLFAPLFTRLVFLGLKLSTSTGEVVGLGPGRFWLSRTDIEQIKARSRRLKQIVIS